MGSHTTYRVYIELYKTIGLVIPWPVIMSEWCVEGWNEIFMCLKFDNKHSIVPIEDGNDADNREWQNDEFLERFFIYNEIMLGSQWHTEGGGGFGVLNPSHEIPKALQNRAKLKPIVKSVKNCWI